MVIRIGWLESTTVHFLDTPGYITWKVVKYTDKIQQEVVEAFQWHWYHIDFNMWISQDILKPEYKSVDQEKGTDSNITVSWTTKPFSKKWFKKTFGGSSLPK